MDKRIVTDGQELEIGRMLRDLGRRLLGGNPPWDFAKPRLEALAEGRDYRPGETPQPKRDLAEERRKWFEDWYENLSFTGIEVLKPAVSNREFARRVERGQALFYQAFMVMEGQVRDISLYSVDYLVECAKILWKPTEQEGYWFWAEVSEDCPRLRTPRSDLLQAIPLLNLEEYVVVWHAYKTETGKMLDLRTQTWLRTWYRIDDYSIGALSAGGNSDGVLVSKHIEHCSLPIDGVGGRCAGLAVVPPI